MLSYISVKATMLLLALALIAAARLFGGPATAYAAAAGPDEVSTVTEEAGRAAGELAKQAAGRDYRTMVRTTYSIIDRIWTAAARIAVDSFGKPPGKVDTSLEGAERRFDETAKAAERAMAHVVGIDRDRR